MEGYIKLHRQLLEWEWYHCPNTFRLWVTILMLCNHKEKKWHGVTVPAGSFISSTKKLSKLTGLTDKQVRLCVAKLSQSGELDKKGASKWTQYYVLNWTKYQEQGRANGQTEGKQRATTKNDKNDKKKECISRGDTPQQKNKGETENTTHPDKEKTKRVCEYWNKLFQITDIPLVKTVTPTIVQQVSSLTNQYSPKEIEEAMKSLYRLHIAEPDNTYYATINLQRFTKESYFHLFV